MPLLSCFTICGQLQFSSAPSDAEKIYRSLRDGYRDPRTGQAAIDTSVGTHQEAKLYGWAMAIAAARVTLRRAANELRPETSYAQLEAHEERFRMSPAATDAVVPRRAALAAKQKAARGPRYEAVWEALTAILGTDLVDVRPMTTTEAEAYPSDPGATTAPGLFRRHDAVAKSVRLLGAVTRPGGACRAGDTYADANRSAAYSIFAGDYPSVGQTFTGTAGLLATAGFFLMKSGSPTGTAVAKIYAITGSYGSTGVPTGNPLATSDLFDVTTLTGSWAWYDLTFSGMEQIDLVAGDYYAVVLEYQDGDAGNKILVGYDNSGPTHDGNFVADELGVWTPYAGLDTVFRIYTGFAMTVSYENWNESLVETAIVKGDVLVVDPGNWGLAERVTVTDAAGSGTTRTLTAAFRKPHSANVYATTGPVPLWTNSKRHVLIVVKAASVLDPAKVLRVNDLLKRMMRGPTTWSVVQPTTPGAATVGPFVIGSTTGSPLGAVPVEEVTL